MDTTDLHFILLQTNPFPLIQVAAFCVGFKSESCQSKYQINGGMNCQEKTS